jgi:hypothetical protein
MPASKKHFSNRMMKSFHVESMGVLFCAVAIVANQPGADHVPKVVEWG